mmetsp:Transcript_15139/g.40980  ORF Transcript_15139/g.40980 Transcript_15139/m.40980 type:complete len:220 (-) Transcript_15139:570-1229(-)
MLWRSSATSAARCRMLRLISCPSSARTPEVAAFTEAVISAFRAASVLAWPAASLPMLPLTSCSIAAISPVSDAAIFLVEATTSATTSRRTIAISACSAWMACCCPAPRASICRSAATSDEIPSREAECAVDSVVLSPIGRVWAGGVAGLTPDSETRCCCWGSAKLLIGIPRTESRGFRGGSPPGGDGRAAPAWLWRTLRVVWGAAGSARFKRFTSCVTK